MIKVNLCQCSSRLKKFVKKVEPISFRFKRTYKRSTLSKMLLVFGDSDSFRIWQVGQARRYPVVDSEGNKNFYRQIIQQRGWFRDGRRL